METQEPKPDIMKEILRCLLWQDVTRVLTDDVLRAIIEQLDYDLAKALDPELSEDPEEIPATLNELRHAALRTLLGESPL